MWGGGGLSGCSSWTNEASLAERLSEAIADLHTHLDSQIGPGLSYGRHRGPVPTGARIAAVAIAIYRDTEKNDQWSIPLTLRPTTLSHHAGQICLPGGRVESGESPRDAAIREFTEELGASPSVTGFCGQLSRQYVYASNNLVYPHVWVMRAPLQNWQPDPVEVAQVVTLPVSVLLDLTSRVRVTQSRRVLQAGREVGRLEFQATAIRHGGHDIWGATAMILDQLARLLLQ